MNRTYAARKKQIKHIVLLSAIVYTLTIYGAAYVMDDPYAPPTVHAEDIGINPGDEPEESTGDDQEDSGIDIFDAQTFLASNYERGTKHNLHLFAFPGHDAKLYRDFALYIYVDKPATYLIQIDGQKADEGSVEWRYIYRDSSEYNHMDVTVIVKDKETGAERTFTYTNIDLIDAPWQAGGGEEEEPEEDEEPDIVRPYLSMSRGEFTTFVALRVIADAISVLFGAFIGIKLAAIKADLVGVQRMF